MYIHILFLVLLLDFLYKSIDYMYAFLSVKISFCFCAQLYIVNYKFTFAVVFHDSQALALVWSRMCITYSTK